MQKAGWITLSREIKNHWIYQKPEMFRAWVTILMVSNFKDGKMLLGNKVYTVKRGQSTMSLRSWSHELEMSVKSVTSLFDMLEEEKMIKRRTIGKGKQSTTLITIVNYDKYQDAHETLEKRNGNMRETLEKREGDTIEQGEQGEQGNNENNIPAYDEFLDYALKNKPRVIKDQVKLKYKSWVENDWHTSGKKSRKINNWKTTLLNTLPHMDEHPQHGSEMDNLVF